MANVKIAEKITTKKADKMISEIKNIPFSKAVRILLQTQKYTHKMLLDKLKKSHGHMETFSEKGVEYQRYRWNIQHPEAKLVRIVETKTARGTLKLVVQDDDSRPVNKEEKTPRKEKKSSPPAKKESKKSAKKAAKKVVKKTVKKAAKKSSKPEKTKKPAKEEKPKKKLLKKKKKLLKVKRKKK